MKISKSFLEAARRRDDPLWKQIDGLLDELKMQYPFRTAKLRKELKWLRKQADKKGLPWGRR